MKRSVRALISASSLALLFACKSPGADPTTTTTDGDPSPATGTTSTSTSTTTAQPTTTPATTDATSTTTGATTDVPSTTTGALPDPGCACSDPAIEEFSSLACEPGPCPAITSHCESAGDTGGVLGPDDAPREFIGCIFNEFVQIDSPDALACALEQLIAGTPGVITFQHDRDSLNKLGGFIVVQADRKALGETWEQVEPGFGEQSAAIVAELQPPAYYQACKDAGEGDDQLRCLFEWAVPGDPLQVCSDGGNW
ncbi:hypothetical protein [Nannocystis punicea]|uniref:Uncharacterized protein n=1 Tax=Nannocystis punicea TaxID=2995304 RepID=A0ABY7GSR6_9BACT|nr:hypothetical protein [Nannocystis poenicansa]WAS89998.1 hypothetical protein O0S08_27710 [Nannocystis poenicansa]